MKERLRHLGFMVQASGSRNPAEILYRVGALRGLGTRKNRTNMREVIHHRPSCNFAASDMSPICHAGSKTTSTCTSLTSGNRESLLCTSALSTSPMPQPGAVIDIFTRIFFPPSSGDVTTQE